MEWAETVKKILFSITSLHNGTVLHIFEHLIRQIWKPNLNRTGCPDDAKTSTRLEENKIRDCEQYKKQNKKGEVEVHITDQSVLKQLP